MSENLGQENLGKNMPMAEENQLGLVTQNERSIEETYKKLSDLEHALTRPDMYIGSVERTTESKFVLNTSTKMLEEKEITFTPGLYKIFDEIVVNAADNKQRDPKMNELRIEIDQENGRISVMNNGTGLPVAIHRVEKEYVPGLVFGTLKTGSNFDDSEQRTTGGRNGLGAKLTNIFSTEFVVECLDSKRGLKFRQVFKDNMSAKEEPIVDKCTAKEKKKGDYTKITFSPDLKRFKMDRLDDDCVSLLSKRAYDIAGSMTGCDGKKLGVWLNGEQLNIKNFKEYLGKYEGMNKPVAYEKVENWEVAVAPSKDGQRQQVSFVNAICTSKGGGHVDLIEKQVVEHLKQTIAKKNKGGAAVKTPQIKNHLCVMVNCLVPNPGFDSQTKDCLTTKPSKKDCKLSEKFLKSIDRSCIVEEILRTAKFREGEELRRKGGAKRSRLSGIPKLDDANQAGTAKSKECTLIITEGDSAKSLAMSGLSVVGRDLFGVFPLRGKPLNVRDANHQAIMKNEEIKNLVTIIGLKFGETYDETSIKTLRYGHLMIMADQDHDGSHIKGLVINFIHFFWPSLLDIPGFLLQFITPIVKATKGKQSKSFFTLPEVTTFMESDESHGFSFKYYKGLGTSTSEEAKDYFGNLHRHQIPFQTLSIDNAKAEAGIICGSDCIDLVFKKNRQDDRKKWLGALEGGTYLDYGSVREDGLKYSDFINKDLILFSQSDCMRSIPHFVDGLKPSQRKVLFACFKKNLKNEMKVAQLAGYVGEKAAYHHGEASLQGTIINMAQNFLGSNNLNLLSPNGQFGTRRMGGKDAASPRYIFTKLELITRTIFHPDDDALLNYLEDDGLSIEPSFYIPTIPLILINGSDGIGTGWSSQIPNHCPREIIRNLRMMIEGDTPPKLKPQYYGFTGTIVDSEKEGSYNVQGRIERIDETTLLVSELPIRKWTHDYKVFLEAMLSGDSAKKKDEKGEPEILDFREHHTDSTVSFAISAEKDKIDAFEASKGGLLGKFKLTSTLSTNNMHLFCPEGTIRKFMNAEEIMHSFYNLRLDFYIKRKAMLMEKLDREKRILENKARFVEQVCKKELEVSNRKRNEILVDLKARKYELFKKDTLPSDEESTEDISEDADIKISALAKGFEYLLGMKLWSLTSEKVETLNSELKEKTQALNKLNATKPTDMWLKDLDTVCAALDDRDIVMQEAAEKEAQARDKANSAAAGKLGQKKPRKRSAPKKKTKKGRAASESLNDDKRIGEEETIGSTKASSMTTGKRKAKAAPADVTDSSSVSTPPKKARNAMKRTDGIEKNEILNDGDTPSSDSMSSAD